MSKLFDKIRSMGYWKVVIHPATFVEKRVAKRDDLYPILEKTAVRFGNWGFPHLQQVHSIRADGDWVGHEIDWDFHLDLWRFYQSGQFVYLSAMAEDWFGQNNRLSLPSKDASGRSLRVEWTVLRFAEIFDFASRLAVTPAGDEEMHLEISANGLKGRRLRVDPARWTDHEYFSRMQASRPEFTYEVNLPRIDLITWPREFALQPAVELFQSFGWNPNREILRDMQESLTFMLR